MEESLKLATNDLLRIAERMHQSIPENEVARASLEEFNRCGFDWKKGQSRTVDVVDFLREAMPEAIAEKAIYFFAQPLDPKLTEGVKQEKQKYSWDAFAAGVEQLIQQNAH